MLCTSRKEWIQGKILMAGMVNGSLVALTVAPALMAGVSLLVYYDTFQ
jgi:hypothetical protein